MTGGGCDVLAVHVKYGVSSHLCTTQLALSRLCSDNVAKAAGSAGTHTARIVRDSLPPQGAS